MAGYKLTVRVGARVERTRHDSAADAVAELRERVEALREEVSLPEIRAFRSYSPGEQVAARLEISHGGLLRSRDAGIDVMGDGSLVPYRGGVFRKPLEGVEGDDPYAAVAGALEEGQGP